MSVAGRAAVAAVLAACALATGIVGCGGSGSSPGSVVSPGGAPYSYDVPQGFEVADPSFPGEDPKFLTTLAPKGRSHEGFISAFQWTLGAAEQQYSTAKLLDWLNRETQSFYRGEGATLTHGIHTVVGGRQAICWMIHDFDNPYEGVVDADACAIVGRHEVVQQGCAWKPGTRDEIERGCAELRATLKVS